jgi:protein-S-isoprenylcysteine O-methyltransferase Ste14
MLSVISARFFAKKGDGGTPAPWDPINNLIISGPYRYVRNPMLIGVNIVLFSESLFFKSFPLFIYSCLFFLGNIIYFRTSEEPTLIQRYGSEYRAYLEHVPRWIPRIKPYYPKNEEN